MPSPRDEPLTGGGNEQNAERTPTGDPTGLSDTERYAVQQLIEAEQQVLEARRRADDLQQQLRRRGWQLDRLAEFAWVARFLPAELRRLVLHPAATEADHYFPAPDQEFIERVDRAAARLGAVPYPLQRQRERTFRRVA